MRIAKLEQLNEFFASFLFFFLSIWIVRLSQEFLLQVTKYITDCFIS